MIALTWRSAVLLAASTALLACGDDDAKTRVTDAETAPTDTAATDTTRETTGDTTGETDTTATDTTRDTTGDTTLETTDDTTLETTGDTTLETTGETGETDDDTALGPESADSEAPEADGTDCTGDGGCTSDPCTPSPCAANELCNATAGSASCTACPEDPEPCTRAIAVAGTCGVVTLDDGEPCTTSSCRVGQTCQAGHCTTGVARTCTTDNPCMTSACVEGTGCSLTPNDTVIPDDGVACTVDRCQSGMAIHAPRDALCGRSFFCGGLHRCDPDAIDADDSGCAAALAPPTDTPCDDTIACTGHDRCRADQVCRGDIERDCGWATACTTTVPLGAVLDLPTASLTGAITLNGQKPPATGKTGQWAAAFYLVARDTGARHRIGDIGYHYNSGALQGGTIDTVVIPGVYDLLYVKAFDTNTESVALNQPAESLVNGLRILQRDVVVGVGENVLDIDVPWSHVTGTITLNGAPPAATGKSGQWSGVFYLVAKDTGARHHIGSIGYHYNSGALQGGTIDTVVMPGTYDLLYAKDYDPDSNAVGDNAPNETLANGYRILRTNVVIAAGANLLDIDVAWGAVTGLVTLNGEPPATTGKSGQWAGAFYLVAKDTGAHHHIGAISYHYNSGALQGGTIDTLVMPGTYDLLYAKDYDRASNAVGDNAPDETLANGYRILRKDLTITDGDNVLDIDVAWSALTGTVTLNGHAPATTGKNGQWAGAFYLVAKDTGAQHLIGSIGYHYNSGALQGGTIDTVVMPGTYDLLYAKDYDRDVATVGQNAPDETLANGYRILRRDLAIADGDNVLDIDVAWSAVTGTVTLNGQPPAPTGKTGQWSGVFYLVAKDTGAHHTVGWVSYHYNSGALQGGTIDTVIMPGTYDLWYAKDYDRDQNAVGLNAPDESLANGYRILRKDLAIVAGANRLDIDVPWRSLDAAITLDGQAPGPTGKTGQWSGVFSLVPLDTLAEHPIGSVAYHYNSGALMGGSIDTVALPGTYHLLYRKGFDTTYAEVSENPPDQSLADGYRLLQQCVNVQ